MAIMGAVAFAIWVFASKKSYSYYNKLPFYTPFGIFRPSTLNKCEDPDRPTEIKSIYIIYRPRSSAVAEQIASLLRTHTTISVCLSIQVPWPHIDEPVVFIFLRSDISKPEIPKKPCHLYCIAQINHEASNTRDNQSSIALLDSILQKDNHWTKLSPTRSVDVNQPGVNLTLMLWVKSIVASIHYNAQLKHGRGARVSQKCQQNCLDSIRESQGQKNNLHDLRSHGLCISQSTTVSGDSKVDEINALECRKTTDVIRGSVTRLQIYFASETGRAEGFANDLKNWLESRRIPTAIAEISDHKTITSKTFYIFVVSTHGDGEPPSMAMDFWKRLKSKSMKEAKVWKNVPVCVIGLGNIKYRQFCGFAVSLNKRLRVLGCVRMASLLRMNEGSEDQDFQNFLATNLAPKMDSIFGGPPTISKTNPLSFHLSDLQPVKLDKLDGCSTLLRPLVMTNPDDFEIRSVKEIVPTGPDNRSTYQVVIRIREAKKLDKSLIFPGCLFSMYPRSSQDICDIMFRLFHHEGQPLSQIKHMFVVFPNEYSSNIAALHSVIRVDELISTLISYTNTVVAKWVDKLSAFGEVPHISSLSQITIGEIFQWWAAKNPDRLLPLKLLLEDSSIRQIPRHYTVSSWNRSEPSHLEFNLIVKEVHKIRDDSSTLIGGVSQFLSSLHKQQLPVPIRGGFISQTVLCRYSWKQGGVWISNGTGIAPILSYLDERLANPGLKYPETIMLFGCSSEDSVPNRDMISRAVRRGLIEGCYFAFSRNTQSRRMGIMDESSCGELKFGQCHGNYVSHLVRDLKDRVDRVVLNNPKSNIVICGGQNMGAEVYDTLNELYLMKSLKADDRIFYECW